MFSTVKGIWYQSYLLSLLLLCAALVKAKSPSFREHDVTHLCVVLYLHAAHEYNMISAPLTGYGMETKRRKQFLARNVLVNAQIIVMALSIVTMGYCGRW